MHIGDILKLTIHECLINAENMLTQHRGSFACGFLHSFCCECIFTSSEAIYLLDIESPALASRTPITYYFKVIFLCWHFCVAHCPEK